MAIFKPTHHEKAKRSSGDPLLADLPVQDKAGVAYNDYLYLRGYEKDPVRLEEHARRILHKGNVTLQYDETNHEYVAQYAEDMLGRPGGYDWSYWDDRINGDDVFPTEEDAKQARIQRLRDASSRAYDEFCKIEQLRKKLGD